MRPEHLADALQTFGLQISSQQTEQLQNFTDDLYEQNRTRNLTRISPEDFLQLHFLDSLMLSRYIPPHSRVLDIGTGPGFPSWPLALMRPDTSLVALDSNRKMLGFLERHPLPNLSLTLARAEEFSQPESFDLVTGRAVAPLEIQAEISAAHIKIGGSFVPLRSNQESFGESFVPLGLRLENVYRVPIKGTDVVRAIPVYRKIRTIAPKYPRSWAEIKRRPLQAKTQ
jgi:16S rRNA (guanine527-N7)-methyltransferase